LFISCSCEGEKFKIDSGSYTSSGGGSLYVGNLSSLNILDSSFINCSVSEGSGGGLYIVNKKSDVSVQSLFYFSKVVFSKCYAVNGWNLFLESRNLASVELTQLNAMDIGYIPRSKLNEYYGLDLGNINGGPQSLVPILFDYLIVDTKIIYVSIEGESIDRECGSVFNLCASVDAAYYSGTSFVEVMGSASLNNVVVVKLNGVLVISPYDSGKAGTLSVLLVNSGGGFLTETPKIITSHYLANVDSIPNITLINQSIMLPSSSDRRSLFTIPGGSVTVSCCSFQNLYKYSNVRIAEVSNLGEFIMINGSVQNMTLLLGQFITVEGSKASVVINGTVFRDLSLLGWGVVRVSNDASLRIINVSCTLVLTNTSFISCANAGVVSITGGSYFCVKKFNNNGAVVEGSVKNSLIISGKCLFENCISGGGGGAIAVELQTGVFSFGNITFKCCGSRDLGGALLIKIQV
jgi:hypothetical protein